MDSGFAAWYAGVPWPQDKKETKGVSRWARDLWSTRNLTTYMRWQKGDIILAVARDIAHACASMQILLRLCAAEN